MTHFQICLRASSGGHVCAQDTPFVSFREVVEEDRDGTYEEVPGPGP